MDNAEFFEALKLLQKEKGIEGDYLLEKIHAAIVIAVKRDFGGKENINVVMDPATNEFSVSLRKTVVDEVEDPDEQMLPEEAARYVKNPKVGDVVDIQLETKQFGRIAAQTAKHVIRQGIREAERGQQMQEFQRRNQELVTALVTRVDPKSGAATLEFGKAEAVLPKSEQIGEEELHEGDRIKVYVVDVREGEKGPRALISRTHPGLVKRLFEMEVPEIFNGVVEIKAVSREAGSRTKLAVQAHDENVDAVGACIGPGAPCGRNRGRTRRGEDRHRRIQRRTGEIHRRRPLPCQGPLGRGGSRRRQKLPGHGAGLPALPGHRQQGTERPAGSQVDGLENRYPAGKWFLWRGRRLIAGCSREPGRRVCHRWLYGRAFPGNDAFLPRRTLLRLKR